MSAAVVRHGAMPRVETVTVRTVEIEVHLHLGAGRWECDVESNHTWEQVIATALVIDLDEAVVHAELVAAVRGAGWCE